MTDQNETRPNMTIGRPPPTPVLRPIRGTFFHDMQVKDNKVDFFRSHLDQGWGWVLNQDGFGVMGVPNKFDMIGLRIIFGPDVTEEVVRQATWNGMLSFHFGKHVIRVEEQLTAPNLTHPFKPELVEEMDGVDLYDLRRADDDKFREGIIKLARQNSAKRTPFFNMTHPDRRARHLFSEDAFWASIDFGDKVKIPDGTWIRLHGIGVNYTTL